MSALQEWVIETSHPPCWWARMAADWLLRGCSQTINWSVRADTLHSRLIIRKFGRAKQDAMLCSQNLGAQSAQAQKRTSTKAWPQTSTNLDETTDKRCSWTFRTIWINCTLLDSLSVCVCISVSVVSACESDKIIKVSLEKWMGGIFERKRHRRHSSRRQEH